MVEADGRTDSGVEDSRELLWCSVAWERSLVDDGSPRDVEVTVSWMFEG